METFGDYLMYLRRRNRITLKRLAEVIDISAPYLSDVENGKRDSFDLDKLNGIVKFLELSQEEADKLMNLAGDQRNDIAPDLPDYVTGKDYINAALRKAKNLGADEQDWLDFIKRLENKVGK